MKRKPVLIISISLMFTLLLCSCSSGGQSMFTSDRELANSKMEKVLEALGNRDRDALVSLFSDKAIAEAEDFEQSVTELLEFYQGEFVSYHGRHGASTREGNNADGTGRRYKYLNSSYDIETSEGIYRFAIRDYILDTADPDNVGIWSLYIIKMEDSDPNFAYWGDDRDTPGINFNKVRERDKTSESPSGAAEGKPSETDTATDTEEAPPTTFSESLPPEIMEPYKDHELFLDNNPLIGTYKTTSGCTMILQADGNYSWQDSPASPVITGTYELYEGTVSGQGDTMQYLLESATGPLYSVFVTFNPGQNASAGTIQVFDYQREGTYNVTDLMNGIWFEATREG